MRKWHSIYRALRSIETRRSVWWGVGSFGFYLIDSVRGQLHTRKWLSVHTSVSTATLSPGSILVPSRPSVCLHLKHRLPEVQHRLSQVWGATLGALLCPLFFCWACFWGPSQLVSWLSRSLYTDMLRWWPRTGWLTLGLCLVFHCLHGCLCGCGLEYVVALYSPFWETGDYLPKKWYYFTFLQSVFVRFSGFTSPEGMAWLVCLCSHISLWSERSEFLFLWLIMLSTISSAYYPFTYFLSYVSIQISPLIFLLVFLSPSGIFIELDFFIYSEHNPLSDICIANIFLVGGLLVCLLLS